MKNRAPILLAVLLLMVLPSSAYALDIEGLVKDLFTGLFVGLFLAFLVYGGIMGYLPICGIGSISGYPIESTLENQALLSKISPTS